MDCVLLRYGEVGVKSQRKRPFFERLYIIALKDALDRTGFKNYKIENLGGRFVVFHKDARKMKVLARVPGVQSLSFATMIKFKDLSDLNKKVEKIASDLVKDKKFKVNVNRTGEHDFSSMDAARETGSVLEKYSTGVSMREYDILINLEIRNDSCYLFTDSIEGVGGLPAKSAGKVLCLFSGGIDSPVASYLALKRGFQCDFLYINLLGEKGVYKTAQVYNYLISMYSFGFTPRFFVVDGLDIVKKIKKEVDNKLRQIAVKIAFYKIAEKFAKQNKFSAIVTGEALSQKSSQTVQSLSVIQSQTDMLIIRPLALMDKEEIIKIAREIGTFAYSEKVKEYCNLAEGPVSTMPDSRVLDKIPSFDEEIKNIKFKPYTGMADVEFEEEPDVKKFKNSVIVDITSGFIKKKIKSDIKGTYPEIMDDIKNFDKNKSYIVVCDFGVKAENFASALRKQNIRAVGISIEQHVK